MKNKNLSFIKNGIVFNFQPKSENGKTGNVIQTWMIPLEWIIEGKVLEDDKEVCFDCIHGQNKNKDCYVRKGFSNLGLISKVKSLHKKLNSIPSYSYEVEEDILQMCSGELVRFGSYGEPVLIGEDLVYLITTVSKGWLGYTHQWMKPQYSWAKKYFMASTETILFDNLAKKMGFRTFFVTKEDEKIKGSVKCPASKEAGRKINCDKCLLCSGTSGKGTSSVNIKKH